MGTSVVAGGGAGSPAAANGLEEMEPSGLAMAGKQRKMREDQWSTDTM